MPLKRLTALVLIGLIAALDSARAATEDEYVAICDQIISSRQKVPELYRRVTYRFDQHHVSREEHALELQKMKASEEIVKRNMAWFDSGEFAPVVTKVIVDYETTDVSSTVIKKRSLCEVRLNKDTADVILDMVLVDGVFQGLWRPNE